MFFFDVGGLAALNLRFILSIVCGFSRLMVPKKLEELSPNKIQAAKLKLKYKKYLSPVKKQVQATQGCE